MKSLAIGLLIAGMCAAICGVVLNIIAITVADSDAAARLTTTSSPILMLGAVSIIVGGALLSRTRDSRRAP